VPSDLGVEMETNPFLRPWSEEIRQRLGVDREADDTEAFGAIRRAKDKF
jgi:hydroxyacylglutathione hydrolase